MLHSVRLFVCTRLTMPAVYRLFGDESGTREYADDRVYALAGGKSRYFVYGALLMEDKDASLFVPRLHQLKTLVFKDTAVEIKSNWLRIPKECEKHYLAPYGLNQAQIATFIDDYYKLIVGAPVRLLASVVDKLHMQEKYAAPYYAPTVVYEYLLQRAVQAVPADSVLRVMLDDISGKTPKQSLYKELLYKHHNKLRQSGSSLLSKVSFAPLDGPVKFRNSADRDLLQVADLVSYNVMRQFRDHGPDWEAETADGGILPTYEFFDRIEKKFYQGPGGRIQGFGIVKAPLIRRVQWRVK